MKGGADGELGKNQDNGLVGNNKRGEIEMSRRVLTIVCYLLLVVVVVTSMLVGCAKPAPPAPTPAPAPKPTPTPAPKPVTAADFYKGKTIDLVIPGSPGGAMDYVSRALAAHWPDVTDGGTMRVVNRPGGGEVIGINDVYAAEPDGLTIGLASWDKMSVPRLRPDPSIVFDGTQFNYLGVLATEQHLLALSPQRPIDSIASLQEATDLKFGGIGAYVSMDVGVAVAIHILELDAEIVSGFPFGELALASMRGEIDGYVMGAGTLTTQIRQEFVEEPLICMFEVRSILFPDVPTLPEVVDFTPEQERVFNLYRNLYLNGRAMYAPPGVPEDRLQWLRDKIVGASELKGLQKMIKLRFGAFSPLVSADETTRIIDEVYAISQGDLDFFTSVLETYFK